jgi:predicted transcriptional regulator
MKLDKIEFVMQLPTGKKCGGLIVVKDGVAVGKFQKKGVAKMIYKYQKAQGKENMTYDKSKEAIIQTFPNMKREEITEMFKQSLEDAKITTE